MVGKNERICEMCLLFARNESNEYVRISHSITKTRSVDFYIVSEYLEGWCCGRGAFILRQLIKQFKLDMVGFDPNNLFISQKYSFDEWGDKGNTAVYSLPFDEDKFCFENLQGDDFRHYNTRYYFKYYN